MAALDAVAIAGRKSRHKPATRPTRSNREAMDWDDVRVFLAVAREGSMRAAGRALGLSQPTISQHLKVLENAGLIDGSRDAQRRPRRLRASALKDVADYAEPFRRLWERRLDNLDRHLAKPKREER